MSEMVERVVRGVTEELLRQRISSSFGRNLEGINPPLDVPAISRGAIKALREPTEEMCRAGEECTVSHSWSSKGEHIADPETVFEAMIDAALGEATK